MWLVLPLFISFSCIHVEHSTIFRNISHWSHPQSNWFDLCFYVADFFFHRIFLSSFGVKKKSLHEHTKIDSFHFDSNPIYLSYMMMVIIYLWKLMDKIQNQLNVLWLSICAPNEFFIFVFVSRVLIIHFFVINGNNFFRSSFIDWLECYNNDIVIHSIPHCFFSWFFFSVTFCFC